MLSLKKLFLFTLISLVSSSTTPKQDETRVVNGKDAKTGQFPYQALVIVHLANGQSALCGGSLLSSEWILTAGHCVEEAKSFNITLGSIALGSQNEDVGRIVLNSEEFIRHEDYNAGSASNDIAVIKLPEKVTFTDNIQPVKLASDKDSFARQKVIVSGFGQQKDGGNVAQNLQYAELEVITNTQCMLVYGPLAIKSSSICARGPNGESACHGDSGGPLVLEQDKTQVGVVSFGHLVGCEKSIPVVYARVTEFREWIKEKTGV
ncbi:collagenase-like [Toxorhynchites rutilus septentrionalis]|uniref:collagenase-like n=1 Tax=Toxorhynchites rutilus septentrionalis TaxID=329112 RepID=UPI002478D94C|nr:collagenase-like [Toxorhynchites rutilus septentrionalis]